MKITETIDTVGFGRVVGVLTAAAAGLGLVQLAAAIVDLLVVIPFARGVRTMRAASRVPGT